MENIFRHYALNESLYNQKVEPVCQKFGLTYMEFTVLMFLSNNPSFDTASDIVKYRHLTKSHVSMTVHSLEEKGLIKGEYHDKNRRTVHLTVLDKAAQIVKEGKKAQVAYGKILFSGFSDSEYKAFFSFMKRIDKNISDNVSKKGE